MKDHRVAQWLSSKRCLQVMGKGGDCFWVLQRIWKSIPQRWSCSPEVPDCLLEHTKTSCCNLAAGSSGCSQPEYITSKCLFQREDLVLVWDTLPDSFFHCDFDILKWLQGRVVFMSQLQWSSVMWEWVFTVLCIYSCLMCVCLSMQDIKLNPTQICYNKNQLIIFFSCTDHTTHTLFYSHPEFLVVYEKTVSAENWHSEHGSSLALLTVSKSWDCCCKKLTIRTPVNSHWECNSRKLTIRTPVNSCWDCNSRKLTTRTPIALNL